MGKIRAKEEKRLRNEMYAKKFIRDDAPTKKEKKGPLDSTWANWCRVQGHPSNCRCVYL